MERQDGLHVTLDQDMTYDTSLLRFEVQSALKDYRSRQSHV